MAFHDDEYGCLCSDERERDSRCVGCGTDEVSCTIGGEPYCGSCFRDEKAYDAKRKKDWEAKELVKKSADLDKLLSSPCPIDPNSLTPKGTP